MNPSQILKRVNLTLSLDSTEGMDSHEVKSTIRKRLREYLGSGVDLNIHTDGRVNYLDTLPRDTRIEGCWADVMEKVETDIRRIVNDSLEECSRKYEFALS